MTQHSKPANDRMPPLVKRLMAMTREELSDLIYGWTNPDDCLELTANEVIRRARKGRLQIDDLLTLVDLDPEPGHPLNRAVQLQLSAYPSHAVQVCELAEEEGIWDWSTVQLDRAGAFEFTAEVTIDSDSFPGKAVAPRKTLARQRAIASAVLASIDAAPPEDWWANPPAPPSRVNLVAAAKNPKAYLNGFCQKHDLDPPIFETAEGSKGRKPNFDTTATILWNNQSISGRGEGPTKTASQVQAALALLKLAAGMDASALDKSF